MNAAQIHKKGSLQSLALMLGLGGLNGTVALAALSGFFVLENAPSIALLFMAGPGALTLATLLDGTVKERILTALLAGIIATLIVMLAAGLGPRLLGFLNIQILKIAGGIALGAIALLIAGVPIPEKTPLILIISGIAASLLGRLLA